MLGLLQLPDPLSGLQRCCEDLKHYQLLSKADS